eukprot:1144129-Pelagomonas_calceolata.AAC.3
MLVLCEAGPVGEQHPVKGRVGRTDDQAQDVVESKELQSSAGAAQGTGPNMHGTLGTEDQAGDGELQRRHRVWGKVMRCTRMEAVCHRGSTGRGGQ